MNGKSYLLIISLLAICLAAGGCQSGCKAETKETIHLFNGKDLSGFYTFLKGRGKNNDPKNVFTVKDGLICISGEELGCLTTNKEYENYRLIVEFKWGQKTWGKRKGKAMDSGVLLHSIGEDGAFANVWMRSIEMQLIEGGTGDLLVVDQSGQLSLTCSVAEKKTKYGYVYDPNGKVVTIHKGRIDWWGRDPQWQNVQGFRGGKDVEKPAGQWNRYECIAKGRTLKVFLNGVLVNEAIDMQPSKGKIQIQSEFAEIFLRRIDLIPLND